MTPVRTADMIAAHRPVDRASCAPVPTTSASAVPYGRDEMRGIIDALALKSGSMQRYAFLSTACRGLIHDEAALADTLGRKPTIGTGLHECANPGSWPQHVQGKPLAAAAAG